MNGVQSKGAPAHTIVSFILFRRRNGTLVFMCVQPRFANYLRYCRKIRRWRCENNVGIINTWYVIEYRGKVFPLSVSLSAYIRRSKRLQGNCNDSAASSLGTVRFIGPTDSPGFSPDDASNPNLSSRPSLRIHSHNSRYKFAPRNLPDAVSSLGTATLNKRFTSDRFGEVRVVQLDAIFYTELIKMILHLTFYGVHRDITMDLSNIHSEI